MIGFLLFCTVLFCTVFHNFVLTTCGQNFVLSFYESEDEKTKPDLENEEPSVEGDIQAEKAAMESSGWSNQSPSSPLASERFDT